VKQFDKRVLRLVDLGYVQKRSVEKEGGSFGTCRLL
jgi:hypothetical protein